ncbi:MAG: hypothetical protein C0488_17080, partial [Arthrobacter sp.]|nr:hypothetical protein [Arthrobacter sp.]
DRALLAAAQPARKRTIEQLTLVMGQHPDPDALARGIADATGAARVTVWVRADDGGPVLPAAGADSVGAASSAVSPASDTSAGGAASQAADAAPAAGDAVAVQVAKAVENVTAPHVLVILGPGSRLEVIPLGSLR